jgi:hypothetical protein
MMEGINVIEMMPKMMMGMMGGGKGEEGMMGMMSKMMEGGGMKKMTEKMASL